MENKTTADALELFIDSIRKSNELIFEVNNNLRTTQTVIKQGNKIHYPDDLKKGEVKVMDFPVMTDKIDATEFTVNYYTDGNIFDRIMKVFLSTDVAPFPIL